MYIMASLRTPPVFRRWAGRGGGEEEGRRGGVCVCVGRGGKGCVCMCVSMCAHDLWLR